MVLLFVGGAGCRTPSLECGSRLELLDLESGDGAFLYDGRALPEIVLELDEQAWEALGETRSDPRDDVHATLLFAGERYDVGLHLKGFTSYRSIEGKPSIKIDMGEWDDSVTLHGVRRLTLNNNIQDPSMMAEHLALGLMADMEIPAPRHGYACVTINDAPYGLYGVVETMDEQFLERNWDDPDGNLYEREQGADLSADLLDRYSIEEDGGPEERADLIALVAALDAATPDTLLEVLETHFDVDQLLGMWAVGLVTGNVDGYVKRSNNYLLYYEPSTTRWTMIPWDENQAFVEELDVHAPILDDEIGEPGRLYRDCMVSEPCRARLDDRILDVVEHFESGVLLETAETLRERIRIESRRDPRAEFGRLHTIGAQRDLLNFVERRPDMVRNQIEEGN